jgi:hypothetical protein
MSIHEDKTLVEPTFSNLRSSAGYIAKATYSCWMQPLGRTVERFPIHLSQLIYRVNLKKAKSFAASQLQRSVTKLLRSLKSFETRNPG